VARRDAELEREVGSIATVLFNDGEVITLLSN